MKSMKLRQTVNLTIALSFIGLFIVFPFQHTFIGGLLFAAFAAATIGGLADSFAVSALFGQPLKIRWPAWLGTNIIARNRDRLINELVDMVEHELLSTTMITKQLQHYDAAAVIVHYIESTEGKKAIKELASHMLTNMAATANPAVLSLALKRLIKQGIQGSDIVTVLAEILHWSIKHRYEQVLVTAVAKQLQKMVEHAGIKGFVEEFIAKALLSYEQDKKGRQFVNGVAGLNAAGLTEKLLKIANQTLQSIQDGDHALVGKTTKYVTELADRLQSDELFRKQATSFIVNVMERLSGSLLSPQSIQRYMNEILQQLEQFNATSYEDSEDAKQSIGHWLDNKLETLLRSLSGNISMLNDINQYVRATLVAMFEKNHGYVGKLVRNKLEEYSEAQLIALVQEKTAKDLQYIRLNGTVVGSIIGILLYFIQISIGGILS